MSGNVLGGPVVCTPPGNQATDVTMGSVDME